MDHREVRLRCMDKSVFTLRRTQPVKIDRMPERQRHVFGILLRLGITRVEKARAILHPGDAGEACPLDLVIQESATVDINNTDAAPVRTTLLDRISQTGAVLRGRPFRQRGGNVGPAGVWSDEFAIHTSHTPAAAEHRLLIKPRITREVITLAALFRGGDALMIDQRCGTLAKNLASRKPRQIG